MASARTADALLLAALVFHSAAASAAPKTDIVVMTNGDKITGEIKSLEYNQLKLSTYHMGTIYNEWDKIASLQSDQYLLVERTDGTRYYGQLEAGGDQSKLLVKRDVDNPAQPVDKGLIVRGRPILDLVDKIPGDLGGAVAHEREPGDPLADLLDDVERYANVISGVLESNNGAIR